MVMTMEDELSTILAGLDEKQLRVNFDNTFDFDLNLPFKAVDDTGFSCSASCLTTSSINTPALETTPLYQTSTQPHPTRARFNILKTDQDVAETKKKAVPKNTEKNTNWAVNIWETLEYSQATNMCFI